MTQGLTNPHSFKDVKSFRDFAALKHEEYYRKARNYRRLYYTTRICAGLSAGVLPFFVWGHLPFITSGLALIVVVATVLDSVFLPKDRWARYSKATDLLALAKLKSMGHEEEWREAWRVIEDTELTDLQHLTGMQDLLEHIRLVRSSSTDNSPSPP